MKPLFMLLFFVSSLMASATPTNDNTEVNAAVKAAFHNTYGHAREVSWTATENLYKASFALDGVYMNAFYNEEGSLIGISRNLSAQQLPLVLQSSLKELCNDGWISELFEMVTDEGTAYYVTFETANEKRSFKSNGTNWSTFKKTRKL